MYREIRLIVFIMFYILSLNVVSLAESSSAFTIKVEIFKPIQISILENMDFGKILIGSEATTINPLNPEAGTVPASFQVYGESNSSYIVTLPLNAQISSGTNILTIDNFSSNLTNNIGFFDENGVSSFKIGATLQAIDQSIPSGLYSGAVTITICYEY